MTNPRSEGQSKRCTLTPVERLPLSETAKLLGQLLTGPQASPFPYFSSWQNQHLHSSNGHPSFHQKNLKGCKNVSQLKTPNIQLKQGNITLIKRERLWEMGKLNHLKQMYTGSLWQKPKRCPCLKILLTNSCH